jgi:hypothetical protein
MGVLVTVGSEPSAKDRVFNNKEIKIEMTVRIKNSPFRDLTRINLLYIVTPLGQND